MRGLIQLMWLAVMFTTAVNANAGIIVGIADSNIPSSVNRRFIQNLFSGDKVFGRGESSDWTLTNWSSRISQYGGVFSSGTLTGAELVGKDWLIASTNIAFSSSELLLAQSFVAGGGNVVVIGEGPDYPQINTNANAVLSAIGSSMLFINSQSRGDVAISSDPLMTGVTSFQGNYTGTIIGGTALVTYSIGGVAVAYESVSPVSAVPEPASLAIWGIGALCTGLLGHAKKRWFAD